ncbi:reprolysin-like metallopeptidase [Flavobacterium sp.]|uniref:zinc-dependent metalloprotease n=1 Tax=Flavobacterium sp. TaxID=239 RepID=UPI00374CF5E0
MKKQLLVALASVFMFCQAQAQTDRVWSPNKGGSDKIVTAKGVARQSFPKKFDLYNLNLEEIRRTLFSSQSSSRQSVVITLPNTNGQLEQFEMYEASNFEADLQAQFPEIRAYSGKGITDKYATLKLSISPQGIQTMVFRTDKENEFMEPYSQDGKVYAVFNSQREKGKLAWTCSVDDQKMFADVASKLSNTSRSSAGQLKTMRLAQSCTGEYSVYFADKIAVGTPPTVAITLAAINATLTRCNGIYEKDLALHLNLISNTTILYLDPLTDPYADEATGLADIAGCTSATFDCPGTWNNQLQSTLTSVIGEANYDIGHLFGASGGGGNAGCIGCVCNALRTSNSTPTYQRGKGEGITSPGDAIPEGDNFDIDYVVHEVGHQLGGNHTFSMSNEGSGVNMEVGSGVTIMGYAGITAQDVAPHSIDVYHAGTISQIQTNLAGKTCPVTVSLTGVNATPVTNAGADFTIPRSTPFILTGSATDGNAGDVLTYSWEQVDNAANTAAQTGVNSAAAIAKAGGPNWRTYSPSASPVRYMPRMSSVLVGSATTAGAEINVEALSSVARTLNFRLTTRDNAAYIASNKVGQTSFDNMIITVDATRGPLTVTSQNVASQSWLQGSTQTITWTVNNTNASAGGANVDILLSTDGGLTYPTVLVAGTPNDGTQTITVPNITATNCRVMVKASASIFFNVNLQDIAIGYTVANSCASYSNNTPLTVIDDSPANNSPGTSVSKTISVPVTANITDVNVTLAATHGYTWDMVVRMSHPDGTPVVLWNRNCNNLSTGFNILFNNGSPAIVCVNNGSATGTYAPAGSLASLNGKPANGTWTLSAEDYWLGDEGSLNNWSIEVCSNVYTLSNPDFEFADFNLYPNPNNGDFTVKFTSDTSNDIKINVHDMRGRQVYEKSFSNTGAFNQNVNLSKVQAGVYLVSIIDGAKKTVKRIVVE